MKHFALGLLIGVIVGSGSMFAVYTRKPVASLEQKEKCAQYANHWKENATTIGPDYVVSATGFFSPSENTCIIEINTIYRDGSASALVSDALTGEVLHRYASPRPIGRGLTDDEREADAKAFDEYDAKVTELKGE